MFQEARDFICPTCAAAIGVHCTMLGLAQHGWRRQTTMTTTTTTTNSNLRHASSYLHALTHLGSAAERAGAWEVAADAAEEAGHMACAAVYRATAKVIRSSLGEEVTSLPKEPVL